MCARLVVIYCRLTERKILFISTEKKREKSEVPGHTRRAINSNVKDVLLFAATNAETKMCCCFLIYIYLNNIIKKINYLKTFNKKLIFLF